MRFLASLVIFSILILPACQKDQRPDFLNGSWQAYRYERADSAALEDYLSQIQLDIVLHNHYHFSSTLDYEEAGTFRLSDQYFLVTDTTREPRQEKRMRIRALTSDTLILDMMENGEDRTLNMRKVYSPNPPE